MRTLFSAAVLLAALSLPLTAQQDEQARSHDDPDQAAAGGGAAPAGWTVRADKGDAAGAKVVTMGKGLHLTTGPALILYRADTRGTGPFHTLATFTQARPSKHPEGYGLFFGGQSLDGKDQQYTYFLVRQDGSYLIKRREGDQTTDITKGWVASPAVKQADGKAPAINLLEVDHKRDSSKFSFSVNGQEVYATEGDKLSPDGVVGLRVNHNLDVHVEGFDVHR